MYSGKQCTVQYTHFEITRYTVRCMGILGVLCSVVHRVNCARMIMLGLTSMFSAYIYQDTEYTDHSV